MGYKRWKLKRHDQEETFDPTFKPKRLLKRKKNPQRDTKRYVRKDGRWVEVEPGP